MRKREARLLPIIMTTPLRAVIIQLDYQAKLSGCDIAKVH